MGPVNMLSVIPMADLDCYIQSPTQVIFTINLVKHPELRNPMLVKQCMDEFVAYYPKVNAYAARITGPALIIDVYGEIDPKYFGK